MGSSERLPALTDRVVPLPLTQLPQHQPSPPTARAAGCPAPRRPPPDRARPRSPPGPVPAAPRPSWLGHQRALLGLRQSGHIITQTEHSRRTDPARHGREGSARRRCCPAERAPRSSKFLSRHGPVDVVQKLWDRLEGVVHPSSRPASASPRSAHCYRASDGTPHPDRPRTRPAARCRGPDRAGPHCPPAPPAGLALAVTRRASSSPRQTIELALVRPPGPVMVQAAEHHHEAHLAARSREGRSVWAFTPACAIARWAPGCEP